MNAMTRPCEVCSSRDFSTLFQKEAHTFVRCDDCKLERIDPAPTDATLAEIYGKHYYDAWGLHSDADTVAQLKRATFAYVLDLLPPMPAGSKLLDLGAATGFLLEVAKQRGLDPYGVELSEFGAGEIAKKFGEGHAFRGEVGDATFPDAKPGDFAAVTMCDYIEHVRDPRAVLARVHELVAPGGAVALTTPNTASVTHRLLAKGWSHYKIEHLYYFCPDNLKRLLEAVGFVNVEFKPLWKALNLKYIREQFEVYPHPVLSKLARALGKTVPSRLQAAKLRLLTGELVAVARRS
jgi:2-polyprenyl-3-methyl-5-hydroxy-6-metoxy-1,4-benzoquinol methylase